MRVYLPSTIDGLQAALAVGYVRAVSGIAFAVTPSLRAEYGGADEEEWEYLAMHDAALASLRLIDDSVVSLRVVIAADVDAAAERPDLDRAAVQLAGTVPWSAVAAVHVDSADAGPTVRRASAAVHLADLGDADAEIVVGDAEDIELCWYHPSEVSFMVTELGT